MISRSFRCGHNLVWRLKPCRKLAADCSSSVVATAAGKTIGGHIEIGIAEDESYLQNDVESAIGAPIDESTTVHVKIVAGTCIAYATVVDASGDNQFLPAVPAPRP